MFSYDPWKLSQRVYKGEVIQSAYSSSAGYIWLVALVGTAVLGFIIITWPAIPVFWIVLPLTRRATRVILTDRALYSLGGRIAYEDILGVEDSGTGILKVRGYGSAHRLSGLAGSEGLTREIRTRSAQTKA